MTPPRRRSPSNSDNLPATSRGRSDIVLVRNRDRTVTVFGALGELAKAIPVDAKTALAIAKALGKQAAPKTGYGQRVFALRPEDEKWFDAALKMDAGDGFVRGVLRSQDGRIVRQVGLKEVSGSAPNVAAANPALLMVAAQLAVIQDQLARIEGQLELVTIDVSHIIELIERDQSAEAASAVRIVNEVYANTERTGRVSDADWARAANAEDILLKRHSATVDEMRKIARTFQLTGDLSEDDDTAKRIDPDRWRTLLDQEVVIRIAAVQWVAVYARKKEQEGIYDLEAIEAVEHRVTALADRADKSVRKVRKTLDSAPEPEGRQWWQKLFVDGLVVGGQRDEAALARVASTRKQMKKAMKTSPVGAVSPSRPDRLPLAPGQD